MKTPDESTHDLEKGDRAHLLQREVDFSEASFSDPDTSPMEAGAVEVETEWKQVRVENVRGNGWITVTVEPFGDRERKAIKPESPYPYP